MAIFFILGEPLSTGKPVVVPKFAIRQQNVNRRNFTKNLRKKAGQLRVSIIVRRPGLIISQPSRRYSYISVQANDFPGPFLSLSYHICIKTEVEKSFQYVFDLLQLGYEWLKVRRWFCRPLQLTIRIVQSATISRLTDSCRLIDCMYHVWNELN